MKHIKAMLSALMAMVLLLSALTLGASAAETSTFLDPLLDDAAEKVTAQFEDFYDISNVKTEVISTAASETTTEINVVISFDRMLRVQSAKELPYIQGLMEARDRLDSALDRQAADTYIEQRMNDLEANYIGKVQSTSVELNIRVPIEENNRSFKMSQNNVEIMAVGMDGEAPLESIAPQSADMQRQNGVDAIDAVTSKVQLYASSINPDIQDYDRVDARDYAREWSCDSGSLNDHESGLP